MARPLILLLFVAACSTPPPAPGPQPPTGAQTAKQAGEATRKAEAAGATGVLIASSADVASAPTEATAQAEPPVLRINFTVDGAHVDGSPVVLATYFAEQAKQAPKPHLVLIVPSTVAYGAVAEAIDLAKGAGLTRIAIELAPRTESAPPAEPTPP